MISPFEFWVLVDLLGPRFDSATVAPGIRFNNRPQNVYSQ